MDRTSQLGISSCKWWMKIWKSWDSLQPSTFTGIPLPGRAVRGNMNCFHLLSLITTRTAQSLSLYLTTVKNLSYRTPDLRYRISGILYYAPLSTCPSQINVRSCLPLVSINNSTLAQLKCLPICHLVIEKMTSHLPRTEQQLASTKTGLTVNFNNPAGGWNISAG